MAYLAVAGVPEVANSELLLVKVYLESSDLAF